MARRVDGSGALAHRAVVAAEAKLRPRVWVPGVAFVNDEHEICVGSDVGYNGYGPDFGLSKVAHFVALTELRHTAWLVERSELDEEKIDEHAIILPELLLDPDDMPHARRWLAEQPLLCVSGAKRERLVADGIRVYTVSFGADEDDVIVIEGDGGERAPFALRGPIGELMPAELLGAGSLADRDQPEVRSFVDRLLARLSRGVLRETAVVNALLARTVVEPGYGYRGATDGVAASVERVARELRATELLFAQIYQRAEAQRADARQLRKAVRGAQENLEEIEVPCYGSARRRELPEIVVSIGPDSSYVHAGEPRHELTLERWSRWTVARVRLWEPRLPNDVRREIEQSEGRRAPPAYAWIAAALVAVLVLIIVVGLIMRGST